MQEGVLFTGTAAFANKQHRVVCSRVTWSVNPFWDIEGSLHSDMLEGMENLNFKLKMLTNLLLYC